MRPANIVTSVADVLAGIAISGVLYNIFTGDYLFFAIALCFSTAFLYAGGIVFNDVFDADLDKVERPERTIPSGVVTVEEATLLGALLLSLGIILAFVCGIVPGLLAVSIAVCALVYNKWGKHRPLLGPLNMGICRGLNLLLGISILSSAVGDWYFLALVPVIYIYSITMISRGEVHGGNRSSLYLASVLYLIVIASILYFSVVRNTWQWAVLLLIPFAWMIFEPLIKAIKDPAGRNIGKAVKAGVISLIVMDAAWAAAFSSFYLAIIIVCLLPLSLFLGKLFAVT